MVVVTVVGYCGVVNVVVMAMFFCKGCYFIIIGVPYLGSGWVVVVVLMIAWY